MTRRARQIPRLFWAVLLLAHASTIVRPGGATLHQVTLPFKRATFRPVRRNASKCFDCETASKAKTPLRRRRSTCSTVSPSRSVPPLVALCPSRGYERAPPHTHTRGCTRLSPCAPMLPLASLPTTPQLAPSVSRHSLIVST